MKQRMRLITNVLFLTAGVLLFSGASEVTAQVHTRAASPHSPGDQPIARFAVGKSSLNIPLEIDNNLILMQVSVNGSKPLKFIFDTAATMSVIHSARAAKLGLKTQGQFHGSGTGGRIQGDTIKGVSISVQGATVSNQMLAGMAFPATPGFEFDGIIGFDFINQFVVEIDYQRKLMNLYEPSSYSYTGKGEVIPIIFAGRNSPLVVTRFTLEGHTPIETKLEVDTGADNTFVINSSVVKKQKLAETIQKLTPDSRHGAGGEEKVLYAQFKTVQLGSFVLQNAPVALSLDTEGAGGSEQNDGLIGGEVLRRFKLIIDYCRKQVILEPNSSLNDPYNVEEE